MLYLSTNPLNHGNRDAIYLELHGTQSSERVRPNMEEDIPMTPDHGEEGGFFVESWPFGSLRCACAVRTR